MRSAQAKRWPDDRVGVASPAVQGEHFGRMPVLMEGRVQDAATPTRIIPKATIKIVSLRYNGRAGASAFRRYPFPGARPAGSMVTGAKPGPSGRSRTTKIPRTDIDTIRIAIE